MERDGALLNAYIFPFLVDEGFRDKGKGGQKSDGSDGSNFVSLPPLNFSFVYSSSTSFC
jgi:hypothetical protein